MKLINILALVVATVTATVPEFKKIEGSSLTDLRARETEVLMCSETNYRFCELFDASPAGTCYGVPDPYKNSLFSAIVSTGLVCEFYTDDACGTPCSACVDDDGYPNMSKVPVVRTANCTFQKLGCSGRECAFGTLL